MRCVAGFGVVLDDVTAKSIDQGPSRGSCEEDAWWI